MHSPLSPVENYIAALMETEVPENIAHAQAILGLMDVTQSVHTFKKRCVLIPMKRADANHHVLERPDDWHQLLEIMGAEDLHADQRLPAEEVEARVIQMLAVADQAFCEGDQPMMPMMMMGTAQWLILYKPEDFSKFDPNDQGLRMVKPALDNPQLSLSLMHANGDPAQWLFTHLVQQAKASDGGSIY